MQLAAKMEIELYQIAESEGAIRELGLLWSQQRLAHSDWLVRLRLARLDVDAATRQRLRD